jgi:hypothetical protein
VGFIVVGTERPALWDEIVSPLTHDVFHRHAYHAFAEARQGGQAQLYVYREGEHVIALPLLIQAIDHPRAPDDFHRDATSAYGYVGPICSAPPPPAPVVTRFATELAENLRSRGVISAFSRLHPLFDRSRLLAGLGHCRRRGFTVSVCLDVNDDVRRRRYRRDHRRGLRRLQQAGVEARVDHDLVHLDDFVELHDETMDRVGARPEHRLCSGDVDALAKALRDHLFLVVCSLDGEVVATGLYTSCNGIVQAHLGASRTTALPLAPAKLEIDTALSWARATGYRTLHLGGGVGARHDSLFDFKCGFGGDLRPFVTWEAVLDEDAYRRLCAAAAPARRTSDFFPAYRAPRLDS